MRNRCGSNENLSKDERFELLGMFAEEYHPLVALGHRCGLTAMETVMDLLGGEKPHIPTSANFWRHLTLTARDEEIRLRFVGNNYRELAMDYGLDERHVRRIVRREAGGVMLRAVEVADDRTEDPVMRLAKRLGHSRAAVVEALAAIALGQPGVEELVKECLGGVPWAASL